MRLVRSRRLVAMALVVGLLGVVAGCAQPTYQYVADKGEKTYFKVPAGWTEVPSRDLLDGLLQVDPNSSAAASLHANSWSAVYDASARPDVDHIFTESAATPDPVAFSMILHISSAAQGQVSLDWLRDLLFPVTDTARQSQLQAYEQDPTSAPPPLTGFELLGDEVLTPADGLSGVREVYNYDMGSVLHTFDYTALTNNDKSVIYLLLIRCTAVCYDRDAAQLNDIATSFTVRTNL